MSHAEKLAALAAVREMQQQQLAEAEQGQGSWTPLRACIAAAGQACQQQASTAVTLTAEHPETIAHVLPGCNPCMHRVARLHSLILTSCIVVHRTSVSPVMTHSRPYKMCAHASEIAIGGLVQAEASVEVLADQELFYARPSVSAPALFLALASTVSSMQAGSWQPAQQLDCLLELEAALQVSLVFISAPQAAMTQSAVRPAVGYISNLQEHAPERHVVGTAIHL